MVSGCEQTVATAGRNDLQKHADHLLVSLFRCQMEKVVLILIADLEQLGSVAEFHEDFVDVAFFHEIDDVAFEGK